MKQRMARRSNLLTKERVCGHSLGLPGIGSASVFRGASVFLVGLLGIHVLQEINNTAAVAIFIIIPAEWKQKP